eukprot:2051135-Rhodomonas_salina.1
MGRFLHVPPSDPTDDFETDFDLPWWKVRPVLDPLVLRLVCSASSQLLHILSHRSSPFRFCSPLTSVAQDHEAEEPQYWVGMLSSKTRQVRIVNMVPTPRPQNLNAVQHSHSQVDF